MARTPPPAPSRSIGTTAPTRAQINDLRARALDLHTAGKPGEAQPLYAQYLMLNPGDAPMWSNLGAMMRKEGRHDIALHCQRRAHALTPAARAVRSNLANILADTGGTQEALDLRLDLLRDEPDDEPLKSMIGKSLRALRRAPEACAFLEKAWDRAPDHTEHGIQLALSQLAGGDYARGFATYDVRWQTDELTPRNLRQPKWDMHSSLEGRRIMVLPEQGFGDGITFARFLPILREFGADRVMFATEKPVQRIYEGLPGADWTGTELPPGEAFDVWINIMDLPTLHFARHGHVPPPTAIAVPDDSRTRARAILAPHRERFTVGVVWTGSLTYRGNAFRSFSHRELLALADIPDLQMVSLYKGPAIDAFRADGTAFVILDEGSTERDFADCAAMMQELDLVITSDTATAHLAGSLGVPVWTLLHWDAFWLWQLEEETTPWYPSMHLIRQRVPQDWREVFARVRTRLEGTVGAWREKRV